jgi:aldose 1-epimerase
VDGKSQTVVSVMPSKGNSAFDMRVKGKKVLQNRNASAQDYKKSDVTGIPLLAPWANRLDFNGFYANGKKYNFNMDLGTVRRTANDRPSHGFLMKATQWEVDGTLEVQTKLNNLSAEPMPVSIGFHSIFLVNDAPRDEWTFGVGARTHWVLGSDKIPTGETRPIEKLLPDPRHSTLKGLDLDDVFSDLIRDASGKATMWVQGKSERVETMFGPNFRAVVVYAPAARDSVICFEPMTAITDGLNLAQRGIYKELQYIPPGKTWQESFWVTTSGF